jgi:hypothetical protein
MEELFFFYQLLNMHNVSEVTHIEVHTAEQLVPGPSHLEVENAIAKLKKYKSPGSDQILTEMIQARCFKLINYVCYKDGRSLLLYQFTKKVTKLTVIMIVVSHRY